MNFPLITTLFFVALANASADSIKVTSKAGKRLLSKARKLDNNDNAYDYSWMTDYSLQFESCHTVMSFERGEGGEDNNNADGSPVRNQGMITFKLCPTDTCGTSKSCNGPEYVAQMRDFVQSYQEAKEAALEYACEAVQANCACDDDGQDDEQCMSNCYAAAGISCEDDDGNNNDQDMEEFLECRELGENDDAYQSYYVGGYCGDDGKSVYLNVFSDSGCSTKADNSAYYNLYGAELPYTTTSMVSDECISCAYDNGNDDAYAVQVTESCQEMYQQAGKCEEGFSDVITYPSTGGCTFINTILPGLEKLMDREYKVGSTAPTAWAWIFALSTVGLIGYVHMLTDGKFVKASKVDLATKNDSVMA